MKPWDSPELVEPGIAGRWAADKRVGLDESPTPSGKFIPVRGGAGVGRFPSSVEIHTRLEMKTGSGLKT